MITTLIMIMMTSLKGQHLHTKIHDNDGNYIYGDDDDHDDDVEGSASAEITLASTSS